VDKARELFERSVVIQPHAPTFVAWAILEETEGNKILHPNRKSSAPKIHQDSAAAVPARAPLLDLDAIGGEASTPDLQVP